MDTSITGRFSRSLVLVSMVWLLLTGSLHAEASIASARMSELCRELNALNTAIRDSTIDRSRAREQVRRLLGQIRDEYHASGGEDYPASEWVFPLQGHGYNAIGGVRGNEYQKNGYDYFDGNRHGGHPSLDIFIRDRKQRSIDDSSGKPVAVLSVTGGVVVALEREWDAASPLRGGNYLWIYDPTSDGLLYYAHNSTLQVGLGDRVRPGDVISHVGRTGFNAHKGRSPTHLHLTYLSLSSGSPLPRNIYKQLVRSRLR